MIEIIGEIGVNHNGDLATACKLVDAAITAGCDVVKTQLFNVERIYPRECWDEMKKLELSRIQIVDLKGYCDKRGIEFLCTPDEVDDAIFLKEIGVKRIKTSSQDVTNLPFLWAIAKLGLPVILSTGACTQDELNRAVVAVMGEHNEMPTILHCVSCYPAPLAEMNLAVIQYLINTFGDRVGLSDHTLGNTAALVALGAGANIFEKHLTLDTYQEGPDHRASLGPRMMREYVIALRMGDAALGDGIKRIMPCEMENRKRYEQFIAGRIK